MNCERPDLPITDIKVRLVENSIDGLLAWSSCVVFGAIKLDNIAIRRGLDGGLFLTYPNKRTARGEKHHYFHPISTKASKAIEDAIISKLAVLARIAAAESTQSP